MTNSLLLSVEYSALCFNSISKPIVKCAVVYKFEENNIL